MCGFQNLRWRLGRRLDSSLGVSVCPLLLETRRSCIHHMGLGQMSGVAITSAVFQSRLDYSRA